MKKNYEKPVVELTCGCCEGVYAGSGNPNNPYYPLCHSNAMPGFRESNTTATTYIEYYGCTGCPQWRGVGVDNIPYNHCSFEKNADYDNANQAGSYETATNLPCWEREGYEANATVTNTNLW